MAGVVTFDCLGVPVQVPRRILQQEDTKLTFLANLTNERFQIEQGPLGIRVNERARYVEAVIESAENGFLTVDPAVNIRGVLGVAQRWAMTELVEAILQECPEPRQCTDYPPATVNAIYKPCIASICAICGAGFTDAENHRSACTSHAIVWNRDGTKVTCTLCGTVNSGGSMSVAPCRIGYHVAKIRDGLDGLHPI